MLEAGAAAAAADACVLAVGSGLRVQVVSWRMRVLMWEDLSAIDTW
jgi:hypothetical protein